MSVQHFNTYEWFFACATFIEPLLADELTLLGADSVKIGHAGVKAQGSLQFAYTALLWSRLASKATLQLAQGFAQDQTELKALIQSIDWTAHIPAQGSFKVRFSGLTDDIRNTQFGAQWVKDIIVDQFRQQQGRRPSTGAQAELVVSVNLHKGKGSVGLDLNQKGLHQRGYRDPESYYPWQETLAAAVLIRAGWPRLITSDQPKLMLADPYCAQGSLLIEGALMAFDIAPGLLRGASVATQWLQHDADLWQSLLVDARQRQQQGFQAAERFQFVANDPDADLVNIAKADWQAAGLPVIDWSNHALNEYKLPSAGEAGLIVTGLAPSNEQGYVRTLYQQLGAVFAQAQGCHGALFAPSDAPLAWTDLFYSKEYRLLNGRDEYKLWLIETLQQSVRTTNQIAEDFANRLRKNRRKLKNFIKSGITNAYRLYDADIPEYAVAVDCYADWVYVQEYAPPNTVDERDAKQRLAQVMVTLAEVLSIPPERIVLKQRKRQKGSEQYERYNQSGQALIVYEHGARFKVNLLDYLDTGLFLDHRPMRYWLQQQAHGKRVLNLFCYTATASVHAALGGAKCVDSVDLSATYLAWAEDNFKLNGLKPNPYQYRFIRANVVEWLAQCRLTYDLIFLDPPTFSNSKRMQEVFDVQRDHSSLIQDCMQVLDKQGTLVFSNNFRKFKLDEQIKQQFQVEDYRLASIPEDFQRDPKIHGCWLIKHKS